VGEASDEFYSAVDPIRFAVDIGPDHYSFGESETLSNGSLGGHDVSVAGQSHVEWLH